MELRVDEITALVGGNLTGGDGAIRLSGVATLEDAGPNDLSFFGVPKYRPQFEVTRAGAVLVTRDVHSGPEGTPLIQVEDPSLALATLVKLAAEEMRVFEPGVQAGAHVAPGAEIDPGAAVRAGAVVEAGAKVGTGSEIGSGVFVGQGVRIGRDCLLHPNSVVREGCVLGDRVVLQSGAVVGSDGYGYIFAEGRHSKVPQVGIVVLEDDVEVGANSCVDRARFGKTVVGEGTKIDNLVQVAHNVRIGRHCLLVSQAGVAGSAKLGDHVTLAAKSGVNGHVEIASHVTAAGGAGLFKSIKEPGGVYFGRPAHPIKDQLRIQRVIDRLPEMAEEIRQLRKDLEERTGE